MDRDKYILALLKRWLMNGCGNISGSNNTNVESYEAHNYEDYATLRRRLDMTSREKVERSLIGPDDTDFSIPGSCGACGNEADFMVHVEKHTLAPFSLDGSHYNWREQLICSHCGLNNRMRDAIHYFIRVFSPAQYANIYMTEQITPAYSLMKQKYPCTVGSEHLGYSMAPGESKDGIRNEDMMKLSFADNSIDYVLSFDVLEHVPDASRAFAELHRVIKPGGILIFTVPFDYGIKKTIVRAEMDEAGNITHHLPPEIHGNPLDPDGCLCFRLYGWDMLGALEAAGFEEVRAVTDWSRKYVYFGEQFKFVAKNK